MHTTHFLRVGDLNLAWHEQGEGDPFVLVHGFTGSKLDFQDQLSWFADVRRAIAYDQRGHGETSNQPPYSFAALVDDLRAFLDALDIDRCDLLGHSLGGMIALRAVLEHPDRFRSLILMDTAPGPLGRWSAGERERIGSLVTARGCDALLELSREAAPSAAQQRGIDYLGAQEHWRRLGVKLQQMDPRAFTGLMAELAEHPSVEDRLVAVACPVTVIVGEHDQPFLAPSTLLAERLPRGRLITIPDAEHNPQYENATGWCDAVRAHLARVDAS